MQRQKVYKHQDSNLLARVTDRRKPIESQLEKSYYKWTLAIDEAVIHENRHGNQIFDGSYYRMTVFELERDAYIYQRVYDYHIVQQIIKDAREEQYQDLPEHMRPATII